MKRRTIEKRGYKNIHLIWSCPGTDSVQNGKFYAKITNISICSYLIPVYTEYAPVFALLLKKGEVSPHGAWADQGMFFISGYSACPWHPK